MVISEPVLEGKVARLRINTELHLMSCPSVQLCYLLLYHTSASAGHPILAFNSEIRQYLVSITDRFFTVLTVDLLCYCLGS